MKSRGLETQPEVGEEVVGKEDDTLCSESSLHACLGGVHV